MSPSLPFSRPDGLSPDQRALLDQPLRIPAGFGMRTLPPIEQQTRWAELGDESCPTDTLLVWEPPRRGHRYVLSADVSSGQQLDYSVVDVTRVGTIREPSEQVGQYRTNSIDETDLAYIIDAIGRLYSGSDQLPALAAIEANAMGISTIRELAKHIGYINMFLWRYWDTADDNDQSKRYGWYTTARSRPIMLQHYVHQVRTVDPHTGWPDYRINSPATIEELSAFQSPGPLWLAAAVDGAHDDCVMAGAIGQIVIKLAFESLGETIHDQRRRTSEEVARAESRRQLTDAKVDYQNSDTTHDTMMGNDDWYSADAEEVPFPVSPYGYLQEK